MPGKELKAGARKLMSENAPKLFLISAIVVAIVTIISELQFRLPGVSNAYAQFVDQVTAGTIPGFGLLYSHLRPAGVALAVLLWLMRPVIEVGYMSYCLKTTRGEDSGYLDIMDGFLFFGKIILLSVTTSILIFLWSMLLFFPGIVASYRYRQAYYILLDAPEKGVLQCIRESKHLMAGNKLDLFLLDLSFIGWFIVDVAVTMLLPLPFSLPIISIFLTPYLGLTRAAYYDKLANRFVV